MEWAKDGGLHYTKRGNVTYELERGLTQCWELYAQTAGRERYLGHRRICRVDVARRWAEGVILAYEAREARRG